MPVWEPPADRPALRPISLLRISKRLVWLAALMVVGLLGAFFFIQQRAVVRRVTPSPAAVAHAAKYDVLTSLKLANWSALGWSPDHHTIVGLVAPAVPGGFGALGAPGALMGRAEFWDMLTSRMVRGVDGFFASVMLWSPDGSAVASSAYTNTIRLMDPATGKLIRTLTVPTPSEMPSKSSRDRPFSRVSMSNFLVGWASGGRYLVSIASIGADDRLPSDTNASVDFVSYVTLQVWEVSSGNLAHNFVVADDPRVMNIVQVRLSPTGKTLAIASYDVSKSTGMPSMNVRLWDVESGLSVAGPAPLQITGSAPGAPVPSYIEWSPGGRTLAVANGSSIRLLDVGKTQYSRAFGGSSTPIAASSPTAVAINPARPPVPVSTGVSSGGPSLFPLPISTAGIIPGSGPIAPPLPPRPPLPGLPNILPWVPQGPPMPPPTPTLDPNCFDPVQILAWSPAGDLLAGYDGRSVRLWDVTSGTVKSVIDLGQSRSPSNYTSYRPGGQNGPIAWSFDGSLLSTLNADSWTGPPSVHLWDPATGAKVRQLGRGAVQIEWSPYADVLAVSYPVNPGKIELWGVRDSILGK